MVSPMPIPPPSDSLEVSHLKLKLELELATVQSNPTTVNHAGSNSVTGPVTPGSRWAKAPSGGGFGLLKYGLESLEWGLGLSAFLKIMGKFGHGLTKTTTSFMDLNQAIDVDDGRQIGDGMGTMDGGNTPSGRFKKIRTKSRSRRELTY